MSTTAKRTLLVLILTTAVPLIYSWVGGPKDRRPLSLPNFAVSPQQLGKFEPLADRPIDHRAVVLHDLCSHGPIGFQESWDLQDTYLQQHLDGNSVDRLIILEHEPVYTLGTASDESFILNASAVPVIRINRGGEVTCHCPGQLTIYPVIDLRQYRQDIHWYVRALEQVILEALELCFQIHGRRPGVQPHRDDSFTGVFVPEFGKVAAVGVKCRRWITQHGVAVNVSPECYPYFAGIVPCGLDGDHAVVTCVNDLVNEPVTIAQMSSYVQAAFKSVFRVELQRAS